jgi:hypothetical protein
MFKKLIMSCMAVAAFAAFVLPASASAATMYDANGNVVAGAGITATNIGKTNFMQTNGTTVQVECSTAHLAGTATSPSGTLKASITSAKFEGTEPVSAHNFLTECTTSFGGAYITVANLPLTLEQVAGTDNFQVTGNGANKVRFIIGSTVAGACEYESTGAAITGSFTTAGTTVATINNTQAGSGSKLIKGGFLCPTSGQLQMSFLIETTATGQHIGIK